MTSILTQPFIRRWNISFGGLWCAMTFTSTNSFLWQSNEFRLSVTKLLSSEKCIDLTLKWIRIPDIRGPADNDRNLFATEFSRICHYMALYGCLWPSNQSKDNYHFGSNSLICLKESSDQLIHFQCIAFYGEVCALRRSLVLYKALLSVLAFHRKFN